MRTVQSSTLRSAPRSKRSRHADENHAWGRLCTDTALTRQEDWEWGWKQYFKPFPVGKTFMIKPSWETVDDAEGRRILEIDPASSFGTGSHDTTQLCMAALETLVQPGDTLLDMGTGGGEFLLTLGHPYALTSVTEGWAPNLALCKKRLEPLGVTVREYDSEKGQPMPFADDSFDLIINRHESYDLSEVRRVLKKNGFFVTQQVGGENDLPLVRRLCPGFPGGFVGFNLENELPRFRQAGFRVMQSRQAYGARPFSGCGGRGVPGRRMPLGVSGFFCGKQPRGSVPDAGAGGAPGLCAQFGAPFPDRGEE